MSGFKVLRSLKSSTDMPVKTVIKGELPNWLNGTLPWYRKIQPFIYQLFYEPQSSKAAKVSLFLFG